MKRVLVFSGTIGPNKNKNKFFAIKFEHPTLISAISIVPYGRICHKSLPQKSKTYPAEFELNIYACDLNRPHLSHYPKIGYITQNMQVFLQHKFFTKYLLLSGTFDYVSLNLYEDAHSLIENVRFDQGDCEVDLVNTPTQNPPQNGNNTNINMNPTQFSAHTQNFQNPAIYYVGKDTKIDDHFILNDVGEIETNSDSSMIDDFDIDQVLVHDFSVNEETWLSQATKINPHQLLLTGISFIEDPLLRMYNKKTVGKGISSKIGSTIEILNDKTQEKRWLFTMEEVITDFEIIFKNTIRPDNPRFEELIKTLYNKCVWGFNKEIWINLPAILNFRLLKTSFKLFNLLITVKEARQIINMKNCLLDLLILANDVKEYSSMTRYLLELFFNLSITFEGAQTLCVCDEDSKSPPFYKKILEMYSDITDTKSKKILIKFYIICKIFCDLQEIRSEISKLIDSDFWNKPIENEISSKLDTLFLNIEIFLIKVLKLPLKNKNEVEWMNILIGDKIILPVIFNFMNLLKFVECMVFMITKAGFSKSYQTILTIKSIMLILCSFNKGRYFLAHHYQEMNNLSTLLISDTKSDSHYILDPLSYTISSREIIDSCSWTNFGLYLIFSLQTVQIYDHLRGFKKGAVNSSELLRALHLLVCFISCDVGASIIIDFFSHGHTILPLLDLIKKSNLVNGKDSIEYILYSYAIFVFKKILQNFEYAGFIFKNLKELSQFIANECCSQVCEIIDWLMPIQKISLDYNSFFILSHFIIQALEEFEYNIHAVRAVSTALRLIILIRETSQNKFINFEFIPDSIVALLEFGGFEMMMKVNSKLEQILRNRGCLRNQFNYIYAIYRCSIAFLNLNRILLHSMTQERAFPYNSKYIQDIISFNSNIQYFKALPLCDSIPEISALILEFFTILLKSSNKETVLKYIVLYIFNDTKNMKENIYFLYQIFMIIISKKEEMCFFDFKSYHIKKFYQIFEICFNSNDSELFHKFMCLYFVINLFPAGYEFIFGLTINFLTSEHSIHSRFNSLMALSSLASMSQFQNKFYKIFNGENNQGMLIISFIEKLLNLSKGAEKICRGIVNFIFQIICIHLQFSQQSVQIAFTENLFIKPLIEILMKFCDSQIGFEIICQFMHFDLLLNLYIIILGTNKNQAEIFVDRLINQKNPEYSELRKKILKKYSNINPSSSKDAKKDILLIFREMFMNFDLKIANDQNTDEILPENAMLETSKFIELLYSFVIEIPSKQIDISKTMANADSSFKTIEELKTYFKISGEMWKKTRIPRFYPLIKYKQLNIKDGEFKVNSNFRDSKFREFVELFKTKKNLTSRLPSLHVDDYSVIQYSHSKHVNSNPLIATNVPQSPLFPLIPHIQSGIKMMPFLLKNMMTGQNPNTTI